LGPIKFSMKITKEAIGQRIKQALVRAGQTQRALASELGVSAGSVSGYVKGINEPSAAALAQISTFCGVSLSWLVTGTHSAGEEICFSDQGEGPLENGPLDPRLSQMVMERLRAEKPVEELKPTPMEEAIILMIRHLPEKDRLHVLYAIMGAWALAQKKK
jgi:transcriptional regulator with XRE-family HTH domain